MRSDLAALLPRDKHDIERAEAVIARGLPETEPLLPALLEWMRDMNWPVAQVLQPFLAKIGGALTPHIQQILGSNDDIWKRWVLLCIVAESDELRTTLRPELNRLASDPSPREQIEELHIVAQEILAARASD
jgi:hypothetical protein